MSYHRLILVFCFCIIFLTFSSLSQGADWKFFYQGVSEKDPRRIESLNYYYDKESIVRPSKGLTQVWFKTTIGHDDASDDLVGKDGSNEAEQYRGHIEINCKSKSFRMIEETKQDAPEVEEKSARSSGKASRRLYDSALGTLQSNVCD